MSDADSLSGILSDAGIRLKSQVAGRKEQIICPRCNGGKTRETSLSVKVDDDGRGAVWNCKRGTCGWTGSGRAQDALAPAIRRAEPPKKPAAISETQRSNRPEWLYAFFADRNIGARTVEKFGVYATGRRFPEPMGDRPAIVFPYVWRGEVVNNKYRPHPGKTPQQQEPGALQTLFNADVLLADPAELLWAEGEPDVMAFGELGMIAVSLKDGAPSKGGNDNDKRFEAMATHSDELAKVKKFILAGDMDGPGLVLREELARRLGRHRCWLVDWPEGCKDACDALRRDGAEVVQQCVADAYPYPMRGLHSVQPGILARLRTQPPPPLLTTGTRASDEVLKLPGEGRLIIVTGYPSNGKTSWLRFVMVHTAIDHGRRWVVFSPESQPWEQFVAQCAEVYVGRPFYRENGFAAMSDDEVAEAERWMTSRVTMLVSDAEDEPPTLEWLLDCARAAVIQRGATDFVIDPWNEVMHQRGDMSETDYTGWALMRLKAFCQRYGVNVWVAVHPKVPPPLKPGETRSAPGPYDISGSANYANKADLGLTIHGTDPANVGLHLWKSRFRRWGQKGAVAKLEYDPRTGRYATPGSLVVSGIGIVGEAPAPRQDEFPQW